MAISSRVLSSLALTLAFAGQTPAQPASPPAWTGWARCEVSVQGQGYTDRQTHTWTLPGGPPTVEGAFRVYPGTWSVVGAGSLQRSQGTQSLMAQWATNVPGVSAPLAVFVRASDGRMFISARHAQLRSAGAIAGYQQLVIDGTPQTPARIAAEAFEWTFPTIDVDPKMPTASGSKTTPVSGSVGPMQPAGSQVTASCTWQFGQGAAAPAPPAPLAAQATPTPPSPGTSPSVPTVPGSTGATGTIPSSGAADAPRVAPNTPPAPPPPAGVTTDISILVTGVDPTVVAPTSMPANGIGKWHLLINNRGPGAANGTVITVPSAPGLTKTSASCYLCPGLTVAQLESGFAIPVFPAGGVATLEIVTNVTASAGSTVTMAVQATPPAGVTDSNPGNNSSARSYPVVAPPAPTLTSAPLDPSVLSVPTVVCSLRAPAGDRFRPPYVSPGRVNFGFQEVAGATGYTVSRADRGLLTPTPIAPGAGGYATYFTHREAFTAPLDYSKTYVYTVRALYPQGCGSMTFSVTPPWPNAAKTIEVLPMSGAGRVSFRAMVDDPQRDFTGILVKGPGLPAEGRIVMSAGEHLAWPVELSIDGVPAGMQTWTFTTFYDIPGGRVIDPATGTKSITVNVP
jgi:hypothetical protein